ncbi:MAG: 3-dehydroquinate synthase [Pseudomonadota bacterium]
MLRSPDRSGDPVRVVPVTLGTRSYDVLIGDDLLSDAGTHIAERFPRARAVVVTDTNVAARHGSRLSAALRKSGFEPVTVSVAPGEESKSFATLQTVVDALLEARLERGDLVIAFGGGVVGDLAGFAASITRRGMDFVQIPTSLLAQVDSSVGGKTGINTGHGKNLVGAFHQPALVLADTKLLSSLPEREFRAGYAEVVKYALIDDPDFFDWLGANRTEIFRGGPKRVEAVARCCQAKAAVVAADEREAGRRALLNLGHTFGHALEAATGYGETLVHGEGVAIGMAMAFRLSARMGLCGGNAVDAAVDHLKTAGLPTSLSFLNDADIDPEQLLDHIRQDKKVSRGRLTFILVRGIGAAFVATDVDPDTIRAFLESEKPS